MHSKRRGQTIIEVMIALGLLTMGLLGLLDLLSKSFFLDRVISDQTKGTYLAEEGIEITKSLMDHDMYLGIATDEAKGGWGDCIKVLPAGSAADYEFDYTSMPTGLTTGCPFSPVTGSLRFLGFSSSTGLYSYLPGLTPTDFTRRIRITTVNSNEFDVQSIVQWSTGSISTQQITLEDTFYNWYP